MNFVICYKEGKEKVAEKVKERLKDVGDVKGVFCVDENVKVRDVDYIVVIGGDGTVIRCAKMVEDSIPIVGIKAGRLGFLSSYTMENLDEFLQDLKNNSFIRDKRWFLEGIIGEKRYLGLNDVVLEKDIEGRMLEIEVIIGGGSPLWFFADGIIVSTPTGSTAYNLSAGGPVVHPACETMQIAPILPHFLFNRGIVIPASASVHISIVGDVANILIDGKIVDRGSEVIVKKSDRYVTILRPSHLDFYKVLKTRIGYGRKLI